MSDAERKLYKILLFADIATVIVSMVSGPLSRTALSIGASASAILISLCLIGYGLWVWRKER